jgi:hypothetical protein
MKYLKLILIIVQAVSLTNCASIIHGSKQQITFSSQPSGATVYIDDHKVGVTPRVIELPRKGRIKGEPSTKNTYKAKIEMDGFEPYEIIIKRETDSWIFGNLVFGGLIGFIIDASSGSMYKLTPDQIIALPKNASTGMIKNEKGCIYIAASLKIDPTWEKIGQLEKSK